MGTDYPLQPVLHYQDIPNILLHVIMLRRLQCEVHGLRDIVLLL